MAGHYRPRPRPAPSAARCARIAETFANPLPMPESPDPSRTTLPRWLRTPSPWLIVPAGVVVGLLLFLVVWLSQRPAAEDPDAAVLPAVTVEPAPQDPPLPAPQPPELPEGTPEEDGDGGVFVMPDAPPEPPRAVAGEPPPAADTHPETGQPDMDTAAVDSPPVPVHTPPPSYPSRALRRGTSGEVLVRVLVGTNGQPQRVEIARSSSHRALDEAALDAVRSWRFQPAMRDGQPVAQTVQVPFNFSP